MRPSFLNRFTAVAADHLLLSLLWMAGCLLLVTAPAATAALFEVHWRRHRGDEPSAGRAYLAALRNHLGGTSVLGLGWLVLGAVLVADVMIVTRMSSSGREALLIALIVLIILYAVVSAALFPTLVSYDVRPRDQLRTAALVAMLSPVRGLLALAVMAAAGVVVWAVPLAIIAAPSLVATTVLRLYQGAFDRFRSASIVTSPTNI